MSRCGRVWRSFAALTVGGQPGGLPAGAFSGASAVARPPFVAIATLLLFTAIRGSPLPAQAPDTLPSTPSVAADPGHGMADFDWVLRSRDGGSIRLEAYRGRVLFVNLWATWCVPCVAELGSIRRLAASLADTDVEFLLISPESPGTVHAFARRLEIGLPVLTEATRAPPAWGVEAVPTTWIVDAAGRIVLKRRGAAEWDTAEARALLRWLDGQSSSGSTRSREASSRPSISSLSATRTRSGPRIGVRSSTCTCTPGIRFSRAR